MNNSKNNLKKIKEKELNNLIDKQTSITELENQLNNLKIQEQQLQAQVQVPSKR